jgi:hypothetical protein
VLEEREHLVVLGRFRAAVGAARQRREPLARRIGLVPLVLIFVELSRFDSA